MTTPYTEKLFSYGTLRYEKVQLSTFGRLLEGKADTLVGFKLSQLTINDPQVIATSGQAVHSVISYSGQGQDTIDGMVFDISSAELYQADAYEVDDYKRIQVRLASGLQAWVYVNKDSQEA